MTSLQDLEYLIVSPDGQPYGQEYAFTIGNEFGDMYIINVAATSEGDVLALVVLASAREDVVYHVRADSYEDAVSDMMSFFASEPQRVLDVSDALI